MIYAIELIRRTDGRAATIAFGVTSLVGERIAIVIEEADALYRKHENCPPPKWIKSGTQTV